MKLFKFIIFILVIAAVVSPRGLATAENYELPEPLVGQATVEMPSGNVYYDGMGANEVILNHDPYSSLGFVEQTPSDPNPTGNMIQRCSNAISADPYNISAITRCFYVTNARYNDSLMISRSYYGEDAEVEIAALIYANSIIGDVSGLDDLDPTNNFVLYTRNLKKNSMVTGESWADPESTYNSVAQAAPEQLDAINNRIAILQGEASSLDAYFDASGGTWNLQNPGSAGVSPNLSGINNPVKYPEGKVWKTPAAGNIDFSGVERYSGVGTIIVDGNLTIAAGTSIQPVDKDSKLGIIVKGKVTILAGADLNLAIFAPGDTNPANDAGKFSLTGPNKLIGSFVAEKFNFQGNGYNISYDYRLENGWPPGFRYFHMPTANGASPTN